MEPPEIGPVDALQRVRFALDNLRVDNGHFVFEELCLAFARARISNRFLRATGPVAAGGDKGMDSETHWSEVLEPLTPGDVGKIVMACTTQIDSVSSKIRDDLAKLDRVERPLRVCFFSLNPVSVGVRHKVEEWAKDTLDIRLEVFDGPELADAFLEADLRDIAADRLGLPWLQLGPANADAIRESIERARQFVGYQDRAPGFYPETMRPSDLAASMTITRVHPRPDTKDGERDESQLYSTDMLTRRGDPAFEVLRAERRAVVLGNPGTGKSTILLGLAATQAADSDAGPVLFARLRELGTGNSEVSTMREAIVAVAYAMDLGTKHAEALADIMRGEDSGLILLDGLDEVLGSAEIGRVSQVIGFLNDYPGRVIISSRIAGYRGVQLRVQEYAVDQLEPAQVESFLDTWYTGRDGVGRQRIRSAMEGSLDLRDLMTIPVMAGFAAYVSETDDVPRSIPELYEKYLSLFFQRLWKDIQHQREDFFEVGDLILAAEELAWRMATMASTMPEVDDRWIDVVDLGAIHRLIPARREESRTLIQTDGMLTPHRGDGRTPLMQREYRWIHRTMQEHLAGRRIAAWLEEDFEEAFAYMSRAAQRPHTWRVPLEHAFGLVSDDMCDRLAERFEALIGEGDPGDIVRSTILELRFRIEGRVPMISVRDAYLAAFRAHDDVSINALIAVMDVSSVAVLVDAAALRDIEPSTDVLLALHERLLTDGPYSSARSAVVALLAARDPDQAVRREVEEFRSFQSLYGGPRDEASRRWPVSTTVLEWLYDEAVATQDLLEALPFIVLLVHLTGGNAVFERRKTEGPEFLLFTEVLAQQYLGRFYEDRAGDSERWEAMLTGQLGDTVAWLAGIAILPTQRARQYPQLAPWAEAGVHLHELTSIDGPPSATSMLSVEQTRARLDAIDTHINDAAEYESAIATIHIAMMRGTHSDLVGLVHVWMRLHKYETGFMHHARPTPLFDQLAFAAGYGLDAWEWDARWAAIQEAWETQPGAVDLERGNQLLTSAIEDSAAPELTSVIAIEWGLVTGIPVFTSLPNSGAPSRLLQHVLRAGGWEYIREPSNLKRAISLVEQEGSLPYWRPHFLAILPTASSLE